MLELVETSEDAEVAQWLPVMRARGRWVVKCAVMTAPYGVISQGIADQLVDDGFTQDMEGSTYGLARWMRDRIQEARAGALARHGLPLVWRTPMDFRITQRYMAVRHRTLETVLGPVRLPVPDTGKGMDVARNRRSAAPNVVHSLDAALLQAVVRRPAGAGLRDIALVHDSFGVHARFADRLQQAIRTCAVEMFSEPWLEGFHKGLQEQCVRAGLDPHMLPVPPEPGGWDIRELHDIHLGRRG